MATGTFKALTFDADYADSVQSISLLDRANITLHAGMYGLANNAISLGKWAGAVDENTELYSVSDELERSGNYQLADEYIRHRAGYDLAGDLALSLIPGGIATKALSLAKLGKYGAGAQKLIGYFDNKALNYSNSIKEAYKRLGSAAAVGDLKLKLYAAKGAQQFVEGAITTAAIDASLNYGELLNKEGMSATEKAAQIGESLLFGGLLQGAIGGTFGGIAAVGDTKKVAKAVFNNDEAPFLYSSLSSRANNLPTQQGTGYKLTHVIGEYDRIDALPTANPLQAATKTKNLALAKTDLDALLTDMFPKGDSTDAANQLRGFIRENAATPTGRRQLVDVFSRMQKVEYSTYEAFDQRKLLDNLLTDTELSRLSKADLASVREGSPSSVFDGESIFASAPKAQGGKTVVNVLDSLPDDITTRQQAAAHASIFKQDAKAVKGMSDEITAFAIQRGYPADASIFSILQDFYKYSKNGLAKTSNKYPQMSAYLTKLGDDTALAVYGNTVRSYIDTVTKQFVDSPIRHIADMKGFAHSKTAQVISYEDAGVTKVLYAKDAAGIPNVTDLFEYQGYRALLGESGGLSTNVIGRMTTADAYVLERLVKYASEGNKVKLPSGQIVDRMEAIDFIAKTKGAEYERLLAAHPDIDADSLYNSVGYNDVRQVSGIMAAKDQGIKAVTPEEIIGDHKSLLKRRVITAVHDRPDMDNAGLSAATIAESLRAEQAATFRSVAANILGRDSINALSGELPELSLEAVHGYSHQRFFMAAPSIGDYGSLQQKVAYIGNWLDNLASTKFVTQMSPALKDSGTSLAASKEGAAEYLAYLEWYSRQDKKFYNVGDGLLAREDVFAQVKSDILTGKSVDEALGGLRHGDDYFRFNHAEAKNHFNIVQRLNQEHIARNKIKVHSAYGNVNPFDSEAVYAPPRNFKHVAFVVEGASNPLVENSEAVFRITANSQSELTAKIQQATEHYANTGVNMSIKYPKDVKEFQQARNRWEWQGDDISSSYVASGLHRTGATASLTPETDIHKVLVDEYEWFQRSNKAVMRSAIELQYSDFISKANTAVRQWESAASGDLGIAAKGATKAASDYQQLVNTLLGSDSHGGGQWKQLNNFLEDWTAKGLTVVNKSIAALRGAKADDIAKFDEEAKAVADALKERGIRVTLADATSERLAREMQVEPSAIRNSVSWLNHIQASLLLRLDATDAMMNILGNVVKTGSEMQYLKTLYGRATPEVQKVFDDEVTKLFGTAKSQGFDAGAELNLMSMGKAYKKAVAEVWTDKGKERIDKWVADGMMFHNDKLMREMFEESRLKAGFFKKPEDLAAWKRNGIKAARKAYEYGTKPSDATNMLTQYVALDIAESLGSALGMKDSELKTFMFSFSRKVNAVYNTAQKPRLFQGAAGIAVSLYQSYQFHLMANLFRYADNNVKSAPAMLAALNSTFFGISSMPGFNYINENIVAERTQGRQDLYGAAAVAFGQTQKRDLADFIMYGAGAFLLQGNMYTRGGLTPRSPILIPSSTADVPLVNALTKGIASFSETASHIMHGAPIGNTLWNGLLNVGLNRPLTGLGDVLRGKSIDSNFNTVMFHDDLWSLTTGLRLVGMRPLNEQVARDFQYRMLAYKADDAAKKQQLGEEIRLMQTHSPDKLQDPNTVYSMQRRYIKAGGLQENFDGFLVDQLAKGKGDLYERLDKTLSKDRDIIAQKRAIFGAPE